MSKSPVGSAPQAEPVTPDAGAGPDAGRPKRGKQDKKEKKEKKVYEAGGIIVCDGKVVLRLTDEQHWIFPKGKLKKREAPVDAAIREAVEETGLEVRVLGEAGEFIAKHEGKKRRFAFYLMEATGKTWDWPHHEGRDTFLISADQVGRLVRKKGYGELWEQSRERVAGLCGAGCAGEAPVGASGFEGSDDDAESSAAR